MIQISENFILATLAICAYITALGALNDTYERLSFSWSADRGGQLAELA